ncbi:hypothetical protein ACFYNV_06905 [Streptomyces albidoflavus]
MRLSREVTGWAFLADAEGVRHAGLAVGLAGISPFITGGGSGGSLFTRAYARGLPMLLSPDELPFSHPLSPRWCVTQDEEGVLSVRDPDGALFVHDLDVERPAGWWEAADASGSVMLVVSHVLPATDDPLGALIFETRRGKVCAGLVRFGEPDCEADGKSTVTFVIDPVGVLMELAQYVCDRIMSLDEAKRRAREVEEMRQALAEHGAMSTGAMVDLLFRDEFLDHRGLVEFMYVYWRLVAEVADSCAMEAAWRVAAFQTVEAGVQLVADRCDRVVFEESEALAARLVDELSETADLEAALLAAARLRMAIRGQEDSAADDYAREPLLTTWSARLTADLYRTWFTEEEPFQKESHRLVAEAGHLVVRALELDGGVRRRRLLALLAQILADEEGVHRGAARAALYAWHDSSADEEPDLALFLIRTADGVPPETTDGLLIGVFGTPPADFVVAHGSTVTAKVISQGLNLARERADRRLLRTVLDWAGQLDIRWASAHRRQLIEARLHVLPDDPSECPGPH